MNHSPKSAVTWRKRLLLAGTAVLFLAAPALADGGKGGDGVADSDGTPSEGGAGGTLENPAGQDGGNATDGGTWGAAGGGGGGGGSGSGQGGSGGTGIAGSSGGGGGNGGDGGDGGTHGFEGSSVPSDDTSGEAGADGQAGDDNTNYGGGGGGGGAGGYSALVTGGGTGEIDAGQTLSGGFGGSGGSGGYGGLTGGSGGYGGDGGLGLSFSGSTLTNTGTITGGNGGTGGDGGDGGGNGGDGGFGGDGGLGLSFSGSTLTNTGTITGGNGGNGGAGGYGGISGLGRSGGDGGLGLSFSGGTLTNTSTITGGNGGTGGDGSDSDHGGYGGSGGTGGDGGLGLSFSGSTLTNTGTITGGTGGDGGDGGYGYGGGHGGGHGDGGLGLSFSGSTLTNTGTITGGNGGNGGTGGDGGYGGDGGDGGLGLSFSGSTLTNTGTITGGNGGNGGDGVGGVGGSGGGGVVAEDDNVTIVNAGTIAGGLSGHADPADRVQANAVELNGADNRLELRHGYSFAGNVVAGGTGSTLALGGEIDGAFNLDGIGDAAQFRGFEFFEKTGTSTWTLTGDGSGFAGATTVSGGLLSVNTTLGGTVSVLSGATLGGSGTVADTTVASGGIIAPGNSIGTLTVDGDLTFQSGSVYAVEVDEANGVADRIAATGTATLAGTVAVDAYQSDLDYGTTYTILSADNGIVDSFDGVEANYAFLEPSLVNDGNADEVRLTLERKAVEPDPEPEPEPEPGPEPEPIRFSDAAETPNQVAAANAAESLGEGNTLFDAIITLPEGEPPAAFDALSGEVHASIKSGLIEDSRFVRDAVNDRIRSAFSEVPAATMPLMAYGPGGPRPTAPDSTGPVAWGEIYGAWGETDSNGNAAKLDRSTGGFLTGIDGAITQNIRLGLVAGYGHSSFHVDERAASGSSDNVHLGLYGGGQWDALRLSGGLAYTWHAIETSRAAVFPGFAETLSADYDTGTFQAFGEAGYRIETGAATLEPFAGLAHVSLRTDGFVENGGAAALSAASQTTDTAFTTLGVNASTDFALGGMSATAYGTLGWRHAFGDTTPLSTHYFAGGDAFTVAGAPIAEDAAIIETGLDLAITGNATLGLSYAGQIASDAQDHGFGANLAVRF